MKRQSREKLIAVVSGPKLDVIEFFGPYEEAREWLRVSKGLKKGWDLRRAWYHGIGMYELGPFVSWLENVVLAERV